MPLADAYDPALDRDLEEKYRVELEDKFDNVIVVDNVPRVSQEKEEKLKNVLRKTFKPCGEIRDNGIHLPRGADPANPGATLTRGYAFIEFETPQQAKQAVKAGDGFQLDKAHVFACNLFPDIERLSSLGTDYVPAATESYQEREYLRQWLTDPSARDQFLTRQGDDTSVFYNNKTEEPEKVYGRPNWTESFVQWSPLGTYLATFHRQGIALWGGSSWKKIVRFPQNGVRFIDFSPKENYVVTWSPEGEKSEEGDIHNLFVWDVRSGKMLRSFPAAPPAAGHMAWPAFKWSSDEKYFGRTGPDTISIYETPSMFLMDKKSIKVEGVQDFQWSPTDNVIAFSTPESGNVPARVTLMDIPSKAVRRTKNLFNVQDYRLHWHPDGDYFAVKVDRKGKKAFTSFELFRIRDKDIPVEALEMKDHVVAFAWEPKGDKFVLVHGDQPVPGASPQPASVSFYSMEAAKGKDATVKLLRTLERKSVNFLYWSPKGQFIVLAGLRGFNGLLEFWNTKDSLEMMANGEHFACTHVEWDPTGRFVTTSVSYWSYQLETGYQIWDFRGKPLYKLQQDKFYMFLWRPRPATLLSKDKVKEVKKNLKEYATEFSKQDELRENKALRMVVERRRALMDEWKAFRAESTRRYEAALEERRKLAGSAVTASGDTEVVEEWVEEVVDEKKTFV